MVKSYYEQKGRTQKQRNKWVMGQQFLIGFLSDNSNVFLINLYRIHNIQLMSEAEPQLRKPQPYSSKHFFVGGLDTVLGNQIVERLRNDHVHPQNPHQIVGTLALQSSNQTQKIPAGVRKIIDTNKVSFMKEVILDSDVIIYDLNTCPLDEVEFAISTLKMAEKQEEKILICISSVMTWANTPRKIKGEEDEADEPDPESEGEQQEEGKEEVEEKEEPEEGKDEQPKEYVKFKDSDFALRRPLPSYETIKSLETLCLSAGKVRPSLKSYVICSGILYGRREPMWEKYFLEAIHQNPQQLTYFGKGNNRIPSIHVKDLVTFVEKTIDRTPPIPYILALDHNPRPFQKSIIKSISKGIGTGKITQVKQADPSVPQFLLIDIGMRPSECFQKIEQEEAAIDVEEGEEGNKFVFKWEYKEGIQKSIKKLCEEFKEALSIRQIKVFVQGPPASGKSHYCQKLSKIYKLPHLHIKQVINEVLSLKEQDPLATEVRDYLAEEKAKLIEEGQTKYQQLKQARKKLAKNEREPLQPFVEESVRPRLSDELLCKCYVWRLSQNDCMNRGYILDGFPRTYQQAKTIFMYTPEPAEGEEEVDEENKVVIVNERTVPNKVFIFEASDSYILEFLRNQPEQQLKGTHLTEADTKRRLKMYRDNNVEHTGKQILGDFFAESDILVHKLKISQQKQLQKLLLSMILPISSNEASNQQKLGEITKKREEERLRLKEKQDKKEKIERDIQSQDYKIKKENEQNEEREILDKKSLTLRKYLDVNIVPFLSEGLHEILVKLPENPVDYLSEFLFKISLKVPKPDPFTFEF